jgi:transposase
MQRKEKPLITPTGKVSNNEAIKKAIELKKKNPSLSCRKIAKLVNKDYTTVYRNLQRYGIEQKRLNGYQGLKADILAGYQEKILVGMDDEKIKKATLQQSAIAFNILHQAERLERGLSTDNHSLAAVVQIVDKQVREQLKNKEIQDNNAENQDKTGI